ncbi:nucleoside triphosphate pyrophosphatase [Aquabacterium sp. A08]|uniref:Maf family protein n=1 Tax=Aquabacterium sp. A08 TaxID=2718532 RepID=UPI00141ED825|nr:Maf family protein [Aquabacterium sp. A08]NIC40531.1 septum formation inhibitor Maf [Aquabacterium sp. A08]
MPPATGEAAAPWVYLASQSPRRRDLLTQWGVRCEALLPDADEDAEALEAVRPAEAPAHYVQRVTRHKLDAAVARLQRRGLPPGPVLCADTTVALGRDILGKPASKADAQRMLQRLAGRTHQVLTAVAVAHKGQVWQALSRSQVTFGEWSAADIRRYVDTGEPMGKAGAYGIQGLAGLWVQRISGSYTGIMGLPAYETAQVLRAAGLRLL